MDSPPSQPFMISNINRNNNCNTPSRQQQPPAPKIVVLQQHHHHHHHLASQAPLITETSNRRPNRKVPASLFAGKKSNQFSNDDFSDLSFRTNKPIGAAYTYNWVMWKTFGCGTCLRCACGWFCLFFAICGILFILWLFGVLWICVFYSGFCEIRS